MFAYKGCVKQSRKESWFAVKTQNKYENVEQIKMCSIEIAGCSLCEGVALSRVSGRRQQI